MHERHKTWSAVKKAANRPTVSVLMSVYNGGELVNKCLSSVEQQTYRDYEIIVVDDASSDQTLSLLRQWQKRWPSQMIIVRNKKNMGLTRSLNRGIRRARGHYVARLDVDDTWRPTKLEKQIKWADSHPDSGVIGCWYENWRFGFTYPVKLPVTDQQIRTVIYRYNPFGHSCVLIKRDKLQIISGYDETVYYGQDRDLWFRLMPNTKFHNIPEILCVRRGDNNLSSQHAGAQMWQGVKTRCKFIHRNHAPVYNYFFVAIPLLVWLIPRPLKIMAARWRHIIR